MPNVSFYCYGFCLQFANLETRNFHCNGHKCNSHCMIFMQTKRLYTAPHIFARMKTVLLVWDLHAPNGPIIANANKKKIIATKYANHNCTFSIASIYSNSQYFTLCLCMYVWVWRRIVDVLLPFVPGWHITRKSNHFLLFIDGSYRSICLHTIRTYEHVMRTNKNAPTASTIVPRCCCCCCSRDDNVYIYIWLLTDIFSVCVCLS